MGRKGVEVGGLKHIAPSFANSYRYVTGLRNVNLKLNIGFLFGVLTVLCFICQHESYLFHFYLLFQIAVTTTAIAGVLTIGKSVRLVRYSSKSNLNLNTLCLISFHFYSLTLRAGFIFIHNMILDVGTLVGKVVLYY